MYKNRYGFLFIVGTLLAYQAHSANSLDLVLNPGQPITLTNTLNHTLAANCEILAVSNVINSVSIQVINGNGSLNGTTLKKGQTMVQTVTNMQMIPIIASSGAQAQFTNLGDYVVKARCS